MTFLKIEILALHSVGMFHWLKLRRLKQQQHESVATHAETDGNTTCLVFLL